MSDTFHKIKWLGHRIVIRMDETRAVSKGGIDLSAVKAAEDAAHVVAQIVAISYAAFDDPKRWPLVPPDHHDRDRLRDEGRCFRPEVGDWVIIMAYEGKLFLLGEEEDEYRNIEDTRIIGVSKEKPAIRRPTKH